MGIIEFKNVTKSFYINEREKFIDYFNFSKKKKKIEAIKDVSFDIKEGETVGIIGLNGAGKSTLIKMMTGILLNSSGEISVLGNNPFDKRMENNINIATVFGQRCKLRWDVSPLESYYLIKDLYKVNDHDFNSKLNELKNVLNMDKFINNPVRTLSLGQKMKSELAGALLYDPKIIFLDEPTIGLDILTKESILEFLKRIKGKTTIILTSHDFEDIEKLCDRIIIIDNGKVIKDCNSEDIVNIYNKEKIEVELSEEKIYCFIEELESMDVKFDVNDKILTIDKEDLNKDNVKALFTKNLTYIKHLSTNKLSFKEALKYFLRTKVNYE